VFNLRSRQKTTNQALQKRNMSSQGATPLGKEFNKSSAPRQNIDPANSQSGAQ